MMKVKIANFKMLIGLIKTSNEFKDEHSGTPLGALKTLNSKKLMSTITLQGTKKQFQYMEC